MTDGLARMRALVDGLPAQIERGCQQHGALRLPMDAEGIDAVVVAGMGGSAIGADIAAMLFAESLGVPLLSCRDYALPNWAGRRTLLVASSWSGNTEETLSAFDDGGRRGLRRVVITTGGELGRRAERQSVPVVQLPEEGPPRAALGWSLAALAGVLGAAGLVADPTGPLLAGARAMGELVAAVRGGTTDLASGLAEFLHGRVAWVCAPEDMAPVARRWKSQLNENAKVTAHWDTLPELDHNTVVGYELPAGLPGWTAVLFLLAPSTNARVARRAQVTLQLLDAAGVPGRLVQAPSSSRAVEALWLVELGDLVSVELAGAQGVDPMPVEAIDRLKAALAGSAGPPSTGSSRGP